MTAAVLTTAINATHCSTAKWGFFLFWLQMYPLQWRHDFARVQLWGAAGSSPEFDTRDYTAAEGTDHTTNWPQWEWWVLASCWCGGGEWRRRAPPTKRFLSISETSFAEMVGASCFAEEAASRNCVLGHELKDVVTPTTLTPNTHTFNCVAIVAFKCMSQDLTDLLTSRCQETAILHHLTSLRRLKCRIQEIAAADTKSLLEQRVWKLYTQYTRS